MSFAKEFKYCPLCSKKLKNTLIEDKVHLKCPYCNYIHWGEYSVGVGGVLLREDKGLLIQRALNPGRGRWTIPGGYVEPNEKIEDAVMREFWEETGLSTEPISVLAIKDRPVDVPGTKHDVYIVFLLRYLKGELAPDPKEVSQAGYYTPSECSNLNIAPLSLYLIQKALELNKVGTIKPGFIRKEGIQIVGSLSELFTLP